MPHGCMCQTATGRFPGVVLAHGWTGVREQRLDAYAERFAGAGLAALVFDYRHFGASAGEPRQRSTSRASSLTGERRSPSSAHGLRSTPGLTKDNVAVVESVVQQTAEGIGY